MLANPKKRTEVLARFKHWHDLDEEAVTWLPSNAAIEELLRCARSPDEVYVMSATRGLDGKILPLREALRQTVIGGWGRLFLASLVSWRIITMRWENGGRCCGASCRGEGRLCVC